MRTLEFDVYKQKITRTKSCDFSHIVAGSVGYLRAKFNFSDEGYPWNSAAKAASFWVDGKELAVIVDKDGYCDIPYSVTKNRIFYISVTGISSISANSSLISTNKIKIVQRGA
jgi:hypothetical protein